MLENISTVKNGFLDIDETVTIGVLSIIGKYVKKRIGMNLLQIITNK
jgi:hypothetical protein